MVKENGFTLIELLIIIAIVAILSAVVITALVGARDKAKDARVISTMAQFRSKATIVKNMDGNYTNISCVIDDTDPVGEKCTCSDSEIDELCEDISANDDQTPDDNLVVRLDEASGNEHYCAYVHLQSSGQNWCIDSHLTNDRYSGDPGCVAGCDTDSLLDNCECN